MWRIVIVFLAAAAGFWFGKAPVKQPEFTVEVHPEKIFPVSEHKSFVFVVYAYNESLWCQRALQSIFEQDYDHYRVVFVNDGSSDDTLDKVTQFINENNQKEKVTLIQNETKRGEVASLYQAIDYCLDREIVIPLLAKDWLSSHLALSHLNVCYQNPDVWISRSSVLDYPSYEIKDACHYSFYAALFKQIQIADLFKKGNFANHSDAYLLPLLDLAGGRVHDLQNPVAFSNRVSVHPCETPNFEAAKYAPLSSFPTSRYPTAADILIFSFDRPMQLYACLESIQRYMTGFERLAVLYRASNREFISGYEQVKDAFPTVEFIMQSPNDPKHDFKNHVEKIVFESPSEYILFGVDDIVVKDFVDLKECMQLMEKTKAYGFYLRFGRHIHFCYQANQPQQVPLSQPVAKDVYIWDLQTGEFDWGFPNSIDMTLFKKESIGEAIAEAKYKTPNSLESVWTQKYAPKQAIGLYFEQSKLVNIPMNLVGRTGNPSMNYLSTEELLAKFNQGFKIDIDPLYKIENASPHMEYIPQFVMR